MAPKWIIYPPNAFNLSKDFIFFFFFFLFGSKKISLKKKETIEFHFGKLMDIVGIFFYKNNLFTKNLFSSRRKKGEASFSLERGESHLSRVWRYRDIWKNFSPSHSPPFLIVDARTYVIVRNDLPALLEETSRLVWFGSNSRFSLARSEVFIAWKTQKKKKRKKRRLLTSSIRNKPLPS